MSGIMITLRQIRDKSPCTDGWKKILKAQGSALDRQWPLVDAFKSNDLDDVLWALRCLPEHGNLWRKYAVWCARQVEHLMTDEDLDAASDAAMADRAARDADRAARGARDAARAAALAAGSAGAASSAAASDAARAAEEAAQQKKLIAILNAGEWVDDSPAHPTGASE